MKRTAVVTLMFAVATTILAQAGNPPAAAPQSAANDTLRKLSRRERKERVERLDAKYQDWVADTKPIALPTELDTFLLLETDPQRDNFIDEFWRRRDALQGDSRSFRDTYYERLATAKEQFRKVDSDRAKTFLVHGPPAAVVRAECTRVLQPIEIWKYPYIRGVGNDVRLVFYRPRGTTDYKLWNPIGGTMAISDLAASDPAAFGATAEEGQPNRNSSKSASPYAYINRIQLECREGDEILRAMTQMVQQRVDLLKMFEPPQLNEEQVRDLLRSVVIANPNAPKLSAEFSVRYPTKEGSRTDVQMMLLVPRAQIAPVDVGGAEVYTVDVTGEVLKEGQLWEKYRYRFDFPGDIKDEKLPIVIDRLLRPAEYVSRVKVIDANSGAETIVENPITVPEIFTPEPIAAEPASVAEAAAPASVSAAVAKPAAADPHETRLRIVPPDDALVSGVKTIETMATGDAIKAVEFWLDGRKVAVRRAAPFSMAFDFGEVPQMRRIRAVALDAKNQPLTGDDLTVNGGTDPFRVRITSPRFAPHITGPTRVEMDVSVPDDETLASLELYWNETRVATLFDPPFVQTVDIPPTSGVGYLRAVATLKDSDAAPIEDVVMINTPAYMEELNVHLIELPTTVLVGNKPAMDLEEKAFKIIDDGKPVPIAKFEHVKNLPLSIGLAIDTSGSMKPRMDEAQKAGAQFFKNVMKHGDKAFLVSFDTEPKLVSHWSPKIADVHAGLAKLRADETTALYDAVVFALYNFLGIKGQKALVLISDGQDTASKFTFDQALEYARRAAVPIYAIGIGIKNNEMDVRYKLTRLANETGGSVYYIDQAHDLDRIYDQIQTELRSQYILGFYPPADAKPGKWRELTVEAQGGKARSLRGYYP
jgi:Ca-activated chloride channel homolog